MIPISGGPCSGGGVTIVTTVIRGRATAVISPNIRYLPFPVDNSHSGKILLWVTVVALEPSLSQNTRVESRAVAGGG